MRVLLWFPQWVLLKRIWAHSIAVHSGPGFTTTTRAIYSIKRCVSLATFICPWNGILLHLKSHFESTMTDCSSKLCKLCVSFFSPRQGKIRNCKSWNADKRSQWNITASYRKQAIVHLVIYYCNEGAPLLSTLTCWEPREATALATAPTRSQPLPAW